MDNLLNKAGFSDEINKSLCRVAKLACITKDELSLCIDAMRDFKPRRPSTCTEIGKQIEALYSRHIRINRSDRKSQTRNIMIGILTQ